MLMSLHPVIRRRPYAERSGNNPCKITHAGNIPTASIAMQGPFEEIPLVMIRRHITPDNRIVVVLRSQVCRSHNRSSRFFAQKETDHFQIATTFDRRQVPICLLNLSGMHHHEEVQHRLISREDQPVITCGFPGKPVTPHAKPAATTGSLMSRIIPFATMGSLSPAAAAVRAMPPAGAAALDRLQSSVSCHLVRLRGDQDQ